MATLLVALGHGEVWAQGPTSAYVTTGNGLIRIGNNLLEIAFKTDKGTFWSFVKKDTGIDLKTEREQASPVTWGMLLLKPDNSEFITDSNRTESFAYSSESFGGGQRLRLRWTNLYSDRGEFYPAAVTIVRAQHITDLRIALGEAYAAAGVPAPTYTDPPLKLAQP